jgi:hypothetical protein
MISGSDTEVTFAYVFTKLTLTAIGNKGGLANHLFTNYSTILKILRFFKILTFVKIWM